VPRLPTPDRVPAARTPRRREGASRCPARPTGRRGADR
jgi:hypothetical protein